MDLKKDLELRGTTTGRISHALPVIEKIREVDLKDLEKLQALMHRPKPVPIAYKMADLPLFSEHEHLKDFWIGEAPAITGKGNKTKAERKAKRKAQRKARR